MEEPKKVEVKPDTSRGWERKNNPLRPRDGPRSTLPRAVKLRELWADPEWRAGQIAKFKAGKVKRESKSGRANIPHGMNKKIAQTFHRQAKFEATLKMKQLEKAGVLEDADEQSKAALHEAIRIMRDMTTVNREKLQAARLVLDFTKAKPASKSEITVSKAEDWLEAVVQDAKANQGSDSSP